jgi:hypothetical protein
MADKKEISSPAAGSQDKISEKRRETRYDISDACQQYIKLKVKSGNEFVSAILGNFGRNGILFECPVSFNRGDHVECIISISLPLSHEVSFGIEIGYCYSDHGSHILGASIDNISAEVWFDAFVKMHDFIVLQQGSV